MLRFFKMMTKMTRTISCDYIEAFVWTYIIHCPISSLNFGKSGWLWRIYLRVENEGRIAFILVNTFKMTNNWDRDDDKKWYLAAVGFYSDEQDLIGDKKIYPIIEWEGLDTKKENIDTEKKALLENFLESYKAK